MNLIARCCLVGSLTWGATMARAEEVNLTVDDPRPLYVVLERLSPRLGHAVTYEDPRYTYPGDLRDITAEVRPEGPAEPKIFRPLGGTFELRRLPIPPVMNLAAASAVIEQILAAQQENPVGGRFELIRAGNMLHVVPKSVRNERGDWIDQASLLDVRISIPKEKRSIWLMAEEICKEVGRANNTPVLFDSPGVIPMSDSPEGDDRNKTDGAANEVARDVLMRSIALSGYRMTWKLFYIPGPAWSGYFLSLVQLPEGAPAPGAVLETKHRGSSATPPALVPGIPPKKMLRP